MLNNDWQFEALVPVFSFDKFAEILQFLSYILIQLFKANWLSDWTYWCCRERWWGGEGQSNGWGPSRRPPEPGRRTSPRSGPNEPLWWFFRRKSSWKKIIWRQKDYFIYLATDEKELTRNNESRSVKLVRLEENTSDVMRIQYLTIGVFAPRFSVKLDAILGWRRSKQLSYLKLWFLTEIQSKKRCANVLFLIC